jgi:uncharacterized hydrophobic protein (TIGR00271 family)
VLPAHQRKTLDELSDGLDLSSGDVAAKQSAFWTMLLLSGVIATAGVIADSTATVIGAMIIAPLATPIMGIAVGIVQGSGGLVGRSAGFVAGGGLAVVLTGVLAALALPETTDLLSNSQIAGRTSPTLVDMVAAIATGLAGAVGLARRDVADVMPGVAIAISLVPPLAVVGVCAGQGDLDLAFGALMLFASNLVALVLAGTVVFTAYGYAREADRAFGFSLRRAYLGIAGGLVLVLVPLGLNTAVNVVLAWWTSQIAQAADAWAADAPGAVVDDVHAEGWTVYVDVRSPSGLPPYGDLLADIPGGVPDGLHIVVRTTQGEEVDLAELDD